MDLSNRELQKLQAMYTYYLFKQKEFKHFLTGLFVIIGIWLIVMIIRGFENFFVIGSTLLVIYLFISGIVWISFTFVARKVEKKRVEMDLSRERFEDLIGYDRVTRKMNKRFIKMPWDDL
ncbi:hypothetical protein [Virgibacillus doumboii]|uniref:hypothetical protein n=1 Tax=Virgibacillus doumboii TaxID=2697503 RepID=UPI0013DEDDE8|nr:hypothetical protein [Virgibacillus doumboii]